MMEGYTDNYLRISTPYRKEWANQIVDWKFNLKMWQFENLKILPPLFKLNRR
jgi:hypothetical protein